MTVICRACGRAFPSLGAADRHVCEPHAAIVERTPVEPSAAGIWATKRKGGGR